MSLAVIDKTLTEEHSPKTRARANTSSKNNSRKEVADFWKKHGTRPYFYKEHDLEVFERLMKEANFVRPKITYDIDALHTLIPDFNVKPEKKPSFSDVERFGFMRIGISAMLARAHVANIGSCHVLGDTYAGGGQLSYLSNPAWAGVVFYKDDTKARWNVGGSYYKQLNNTTIEELGIPNPIVMINVALGWDNEGIPSLLIGKINGDSSTPNWADRFVRFVRYTLGLQVLMYNRYTSIPVKTVTTKVFHTTPCLSQFTLSTPYTVHRSTDFSALHGRRDNDSNLFTVLDKSICYEVDLSNFFSPREITSLPPIAKSDHTLDISSYAPTPTICLWTHCNAKGDK